MKEKKKRKLFWWIWKECKGDFIIYFLYENVLKVWMIVLFIGFKRIIIIDMLKFIFYDRYYVVICYNKGWK